jgi:SAM-dependent methyltransferase
LVWAGTTLAAWALSGTRHTDPIDGRSYRRFLSHGPRFRVRENVLGPGTLSLERHRGLWLFLERETAFFSAPLRVLHFAPEICFASRFRKLANLDYVAADLSSPLADHQVDLHELPFRDSDFDVIICNHVLEHVADDRRCMRELRRVLCPKGFALLNVPLDPSRAITFEDPSVVDPRERQRLYGQGDHVRLYGADYVDRLREAGFRVDVKDYVRRFSAEEIQKYRLDAADKLFYAVRA